MPTTTFQILHRFTNAVIFECELPESIAAQSIAKQRRYAAKQALAADANLADADLADANLAGANLADAYLAGARNVPETNGSESVQPHERATTDEQRAARYAKRSAKFRERNPDVPVIPDIDARILALVDSGAGKLDMGAWHSCQTTHCRSGWAITLGGEAGKALEEKYGPFHAGRMIYIASTGRVPHFFASNEAAMEDLRACAAGQEARS